MSSTIILPNELGAICSPSGEEWGVIVRPDIPFSNISSPPGFLFTAISGSSPMLHNYSQDHVQFAGIDLFRLGWDKNGTPVVKTYQKSLERFGTSMFFAREILRQDIPYHHIKRLEDFPSSIGSQLNANDVNNIEQWLNQDMKLSYPLVSMVQNESTTPH